MRADYKVLLDACVLANQGVCDLLLHLCERPRLFLPHWSEAILDEVRRTHADRLNWPGHLVESFQVKIRESFPEAMVAGYEPLMESLANDPKDRHVLAAAIKGGCPLILTFNLKHFPASALASYNIKAAHPQTYLLTLYEMEPQQVVGCLGQIAGRRSLELEDVLIRLGRVLPELSSRVLDELSR